MEKAASFRFSEGLFEENRDQHVILAELSGFVYEIQLQLSEISKSGENIFVSSRKKYFCTEFCREIIYEFLDVENWTKCV